jgi:P27 family predicted phage terminase small subunit
MGKRGPKKTPLALAAVDGRSLDQDPPTLPPDDERPIPPAWLTPLARAEWDRICDALWGMGCLEQIDQGMFAAYCQAWGRYEQGEIDLNAAIAAELSKTPSRKVGKKTRRKPLKPQAHGAVAKTAAGNLIVNPLFGLVNTLRRDMQRLAAEFGLSPSARAGLGGSGGGGKVKDPIAQKYFGGNGG